MSKAKIYGNPNPVIGIKEYYSIHDFFGSSAPSKFMEPLENIPDENIKWSVWILLGNEWVKMTKNNKTGATVDYTFTQTSITRKGIRMLVEANGEKAVLDIKTKKNVESKILHIEILDNLGKKPTKLFSYGETITARVHCLNMEKFRINVTLWENDGGKKDLSDISIETKETNVLKGIADVKFTFDTSKVWLANAKTASGESNEGAFHEYYVTAEFYKKVSKPTQDINVINPDYKVDILSKTSASKPSETETKKTSPAEQKGPSKKETRGIAKADRRMHDYHEQKVGVESKISNNPIFEVINSPMIVDTNYKWWENDKKSSICPNCDKEITLHEFNLMFPGSTNLFNKGINGLSHTTLQEFVNALNLTLKEFKINTCTRKAFFLAQIARETGDFTRIDENLNYSSESALHAHWSNKNNPLLYSHASTFFNYPERLGNYVYRDIGENGNENSGDGYTFRGRGLIQITRKKGYRRFGEYSDTNLITNPDLLLNNLNLLVRSAGWYWQHGVLLKDGSEKDINTIADLEDFKRTTELVHGGTTDVIKREEILNRIKPILKTNGCKRNVAEILSDADIEYHVFYSGIIRYKIKNEKRENASYYYHDNSGNVHSIGKYELKKITNRFGRDYRDKLDSSNIYLIDIRNLKNYQKGDVKFNLKMNPGTNRFFMNDVTIASFIGAMLDCRYSDFIFNGFSDDLGNSIGGSESHKNGMNGDLRYLRKDKSGKNVHLSLVSETGDPCGWKGMDEKRQNAFNDALYKYGWKSMLSWRYNGKMLNHSIHYIDHHHHLHVQSFNPILKNIK
ncbi:MAG: glycoside hydrolase family 19 protein [Flavobacterium sp.]|uniref:glycoside hydrolase family 19 protein n=1 Tax=Flavobacterium sp. TaxID=239 RepID=UPI002FCAFF9E